MITKLSLPCSVRMILKQVGGNWSSNAAYNITHTLNYVTAVVFSSASFLRLNTSSLHFNFEIKSYNECHLPLLRIQRNNIWITSTSVWKLPKLVTSVNFVSLYSMFLTLKLAHKKIHDSQSFWQLNDCESFVPRCPTYICFCHCSCLDSTINLECTPRKSDTL